MSHIPNAAMKHAGPTHHDDALPAKPSPAKAASKGPGVGTWVAIGSTLLAGAAAAIAVPLLKARTVPVATRRGKRATLRKTKPRKAGTK